MSENELKVYRAICEGTATTIIEVSAESGVSQASVRRAIASLTEKGLIQRSGGRKYGKWIQK
ncbi:MAG: helix-turn-helix domain-containing protein [Methanomassiliicoccaceae archaeon]|nr:helix-turn-helix domain-containing protein [Methanomassiliicoccaceae archaeon]